MKGWGGERRNRGGMRIEMWKKRRNLPVHPSLCDILLPHSFGGLIVKRKTQKSPTIYFGLQ